MGRQIEKQAHLKSTPLLQVSKKTPCHLFLQRGLDSCCRSPKFRRKRDTMYCSVYANPWWTPSATPVFTSAENDSFNQVVTISPSLLKEMVYFIPSSIASSWILEESPPRKLCLFIISTSARDPGHSQELDSVLTHNRRQSLPCRDYNLKSHRWKKKEKKPKQNRQTGSANVES